MKEYKVGDKVWLARCQNEQVKITCPACFGKLQIKVILGNNEEVIVPCNGCDRGYYGSLGYIEEYDYTRRVELVTITRVDAEETIEGRKIEHYYLDGGGCVYPNDDKLFDTKEEAEIRADELIEKYELEKQDSIKRKKENPAKTYGWHVRYHSREIKELEKKLEYHRAKLIIIKPLAKENKKNEEKKIVGENI